MNQTLLHLMLSIQAASREGFHHFADALTHSLEVELAGQGSALASARLAARGMRP